MSASPFDTGACPDRGSDAPLALDLHEDTGSTSLPRHAPEDRIPRAWLGMSSYLGAGVLVGLVIIVAMTFARSDASKAAAGVVTDNIVHLDARAIGDSCWRGNATGAPLRLTVSLEVGLDGKVRNAVASGEPSPMRSCVESHVKAWEFLPQAAPSQMVLPFEIAPR